MDDVCGHKIIKTRKMTKEELAQEGWLGSYPPGMVLELDNGIILYASRDEEGNGPGCMFGKGKVGGCFVLWPVDD